MTDAISQSEKINSLLNIFKNMSYNVEQSCENLPNIKKWISENARPLSSMLNGKPVKGDEKWKITGMEVEIDVIQEEKTFLKHYEKPSASKELVEWSTEKVLKLQQLIKSKSQDLISLESIAGAVPAWTVRLHDEPKWIKATTSKVSKQLLSEFSTSGSQILLITLDKATYSLENIVKVLSAALHLKKVILMISIKDIPSAGLLFPLVYLLESLENVIILGDKMPASKVLKLLKDERVISVGYQVLGTAWLSAEVDFTRNSGESINFVVTDTADIPSAVSSISRNGWNCGVTINHRCRSLVFVHQSVHDTVIDAIAKSSDEIETIDISAYESRPGTDKCIPTIVRNAGTATNVVSIKVPGKGHLLVAIPYRSIAELVSLANVGHTHGIFLYSNDVTATSEIVNKLQAETLVLNDKNIHSNEGGVVELSYAVVTVTQTASSDQKKTTVPSKFKLGPVKEWQNLSSHEKAKRVKQFLNVGDSVLDNFTRAFFTEQFQANTAPSSRVNGIIFNDLTFSKDVLNFAIVACILRGGQTVIICPDQLASSLEPEVKNNFPDGLVTVLKLKSTDLFSSSENWEFTWVIHSDKNEFDVNSISRSSWNKTMIISNTQQSIMDCGTKIMRGNTFKMLG